MIAAVARQDYRFPFVSVLCFAFGINSTRQAGSYHIAFIALIIYSEEEKYIQRAAKLSNKLAIAKAQYQFLQAIQEAV